jgi:hypothetical protein
LLLPSAGEETYHQYLPARIGVNPLPEGYEPSPLGVATPTVTPDALQLAGALFCGPKAVKLSGAESFFPEVPERVARIDPELIVRPAVPVPGTETVRTGEAGTTLVSVIAGPQRDLEATFVEPLGYDAYHQ